MHAIHFPQGTLSFFSYEQSDWGSELCGRYISVQERSTEKVWFILVIYSTAKSPAGACCQSHWHHLRVASKHWVGKKKDSCLQIQTPVMFFDETGIKKVNWGFCCGIKYEEEVMRLWNFNGIFLILNIKQHCVVINQWCYFKIHLGTCLW